MATSSSSTPRSSSGPSFTHLLPPTYKRHVASWLEEDCPTFDYGGYVVGDGPATAYLWCKSPGVLAGVPFFEEVFRQVGCQVAWHVKEGTWVDPTTTSNNDTNLETKATTHTAAIAATATTASVSNGTSTNPPNPPLPAPPKHQNPISTNNNNNTTSTGSGRTHIATVTGPTNAILLGERLALNILARCSGVATASARLLAQVRAHGFRGTLAGTRKTTPGFRLVEKYGMLVGGCDTHRIDLSGMVMLKDNHVLACRQQQQQQQHHGSPAPGPAAPTGTNPSGSGSGSEAGGIAAAVRQARRAAGFGTKIEVEVSSEREAQEAVDAGADVVMLDNFPLSPAAPPASSLSSSSATASATATAPQGDNNVDNDNDPSVAAVARRLKRRYRGRRTFLIEVSGGITEANVGGYLAGCGAAPSGSGSGSGSAAGVGEKENDGGDDDDDEGVDVVSTSAIHQGVKHVDFSLKVI